MLALSLTAFALPAFAGNAHFIKSFTTGSISGNSSGATLTVSFKEAGLESGSVETITVSGDALTTFECVNNGGKNPSASNKTTTKTRFSQSGTFTADRNGNVTGRLSVSNPSASDLGFRCPSGQTVTFVSVTFSNVTIADETSGASTSLGGSFSFTNPSAP
jgi:hypothetical protein